MSLKHNFIDYVKLYCTSGKGGQGVTSWRREKHVPQGGPDGGDGGDGGSIVIEGDEQLWTLLDLKYRKYIKAENGQPGAGSKKKGKRGSDTILKVPLGTVVKDAETEVVLGEIKEQGQRIVALPGGHGGLGNWHFRTSTNQVPEKSTTGTEGQERVLTLELKVLADVGLVGFPNAGKSTLLSVITSAKPEIGAYPFTTLVPNLGIVKYRDWQSFVMADIPGIIEGASEGKGLGTRFLRHIERNAILLYMIPADAEDPKNMYQTLKQELKNYDQALTQTPALLTVSKIDIANEELRKKLKKELKEVDLMFSAVSGENIPELLDLLWNKLQVVNSKN